jgi:hypothetical protein
MQLAPMRYARIEGTAVGVTVASAAEAKAAIKELRHKKREMKFLRGALVRRQKAARVKSRNNPQQMGGFQMFLDDMRWAFATLVLRRTHEAKSRSVRTLSTAEVEAELRRCDEILHNIDGCILQLEGKLLSRK